MEEEEKNGFKPGYLGKNLDGHEEAFDPKAWSEIEAKLKERKRKRAFFWWFCGLGIGLSILVFTIFVQLFHGEGNTQVSILEDRYKPVQKENNSTSKKNRVAKLLPSNEKKQSDLHPSGLNEKKEDSKSGSSQNEKIKAARPDLARTKSIAEKSNDFKNSQKVFPKPGKKEIGQMAIELKSGEEIFNQTSRSEKSKRRKPARKADQSKLLTDSDLKSKENLLPTNPEQKMSMNQEEKGLRNNDKPSQNFSESAEKMNMEKVVQNTLKDAVSVGKTEVVPAVPLVPTQIESNNQQSEISSGQDSILKKVGLLKVGSDSLKSVLLSDSIHKQKAKVGRFWMVSIHGGSMSQDASLAQNNNPEYQFYRFDLNQKPLVPIYVSLRVSHLWQIHSAFTLGVRLSYTLIQQQLHSNLDPAKYAPSVYKFSDDGTTIIASAENQNDQTVFSRTTQMLEPGLIAQWKPSWSPVGVHLAFQGLGLNLGSGNNIFEGKTFSNFQLHSGLFIPFRNRFQIQADVFFLKAEDHYLPVPVRSSGSGFVGSVGFGWKF